MNKLGDRSVRSVWIWNVALFATGITLHRVHVWPCTVVNETRLYSQWCHFSQILGAVDPTSDRSYPLANHPPAQRRYWYTELSAVDSRPTFISNIHYQLSKSCTSHTIIVEVGYKHFHNCDKSPYSLTFGGRPTPPPPIHAPPSWRHCM